MLSFVLLSPLPWVSPHCHSSCGNFRPEPGRSHREDWTVCGGELSLSCLPPQPKLTSIFPAFLLHSWTSWSCLELSSTHTGFWRPQPSVAQFLLSPCKMASSWFSDDTVANSENVSKFFDSNLPLILKHLGSDNSFWPHCHPISQAFLPFYVAIPPSSLGSSSLFSRHPLFFTYSFKCFLLSFRFKF